jgi:beta-mannosidase
MRIPVPLHRGWKFFEPRRRRWFAARVPGCVHLDLRRHRLIADPFWADNERGLDWIEREDWIYATRFEVSAALLARQHVDLVADGLDTVAAITLNGRPLGRVENMFVGHRFPVRDRLRRGRNELRIRFTSPMDYIRRHRPRDHYPEWNDPVGGCSVIRKQQCSFGWDWGPRFPTCGIYKPIRLEAYDGRRLDTVRVRQVHHRGRVTLQLKADQPVRARLLFAGRLVAEGTDRLTVRAPRLWWPNRLGRQPLYELLVENADGDRWHRRIGLRTVALERRPDRWGESFRFVVNGRAIFAKGANWIPAHSFVPAVSRATYQELLQSAVEANMNMLRVWGGGIYEMDEFYDLCDEKGLLVWQDFMFACALYPGERRFLRLVGEEAQWQVKRLRHHACLALWCGNNEIEQMPQEILRTKRRQRAYETVFYRILPDAVARHDGVTAYWPCSPHNPRGYKKGFNNPRAGDCHFWDVWHARHPVKRYEETKFRFCSEFGMQSYSSPEVARAYCPPDQMNVFAPAMENHQKHGAGNLIMLEYISRLYRFPKDYAALAYLSQLNQAHCIRVGVEHFRRSMPRTMGALYWQLNDCWPVASWSSIEFGGRWKALHHAARRFFAPSLVCAHVPGDEHIGKLNRIISTIHDVNLYTVHDHPRPARGTLGWTLYHLDGRILRRGRKPVALRCGESALQQRLDFAPELAEHGARNIQLRIWLEIAGRVVSQNSVLFTAPRLIEFRSDPIQLRVTRGSPVEFAVELRSAAFHHQVELDLPGLRHRTSDNFFDLYPRLPRRVVVRLERPLTVASLRRRLRVRSLVDSYR